MLQALTIRNAATVQARLVEGVRPDNPVVAFGMPDFDFSAASTLGKLDSEIVRQALMVSYIDSFWVLFITCVVAAPLVLLLKK